MIAKLIWQSFKLARARPSSPSIKAKIASDHPLFGVIEQAYQVFNYPKPTSTEACRNWCMAPRIEANFFNPPIRQLPLEYVRDWFHAAYDSNAGVAKATWAYLLPRLLEILAAGEDVSPIGLEVSLSRFCTGNTSNWRRGSDTEHASDAYRNAPVGSRSLSAKNQDHWRTGSFGSLLPYRTGLC